MVEVIIENVVQIAATLLITLIGVLGTWLTAKIGKKMELANINAATDEVIKMAQQTVSELQQTMVEEFKAAHEDKKLTKAEIEMLGTELIGRVIEKMSKPTYNLLNAAGVDIANLIKSAGEDKIREMKMEW